VQRGIKQRVDEFLLNTREYWKEWSKYSSLPFEFQQKVLRAAQVLRIMVYDESGSIVNSLSTSLPDSSGVVADLRYCW